MSYKIVCRGSDYIDELDGYGTARAAIDEVMACIEPEIIVADIVEVVRVHDDTIVCWFDVNGEKGTDLSVYDDDYSIAIDFLTH